MKTTRVTAFYKYGLRTSRDCKVYLGVEKKVYLGAGQKVYLSAESQNQTKAQKLGQPTPSVGQVRNCLVHIKRFNYHIKSKILQKKHQLSVKEEIRELTRQQFSANTATLQKSTS